MIRISASISRSRAKASSIFPNLEGMLRQRSMGQHQQAFDSVPPITTPPITTPTDPTAVPASPFAPDFDADPPVRPGDDDPPITAVAGTEAAGRDSDSPPGSPPRGPEAPQPPVSPPGQPEVFPPHGRM